LPAVQPGEALTLAQLEAKGHTTQPPARFTEASLVKELENSGVGRPSTYAMIIETIQQRQYVTKEKGALVPSFMAFAVVGLLERYFAHLVDVTFTARMEDDLDQISLGQRESLPYLQHFYFGTGQDLSAASEQGLKDLLGAEIDARDICTLPLGKDAAGVAINVRIGRYGPFLERGEERASIPDGLPPDELNIERAVQLLERGAGPTELGQDPTSGRKVYVKSGRFGPYVQLGENGEEPKMKSLLPGMLPEEVTLEQAMRLLNLPREVGADGDGVMIYADFGRYGPYIKRGSDTRSLESPEQIFEVDVPAALEVLAKEKKGGFSRSAPKQLRELGPSPKGQPVKLLAGRYGPYVSDGETNASLPKGLAAEQCSLEQALELLAARAAAGGGKKKVGKRFAKKAASKPAAAGGEKAAKKTAKKATKKAAKKAAKKVGKSAEPTAEAAESDDAQG
jgi:DNA topoisomerase-1